MKEKMFSIFHTCMHMLKIYDLSINCNVYIQIQILLIEIICICQTSKFSIDYNFSVWNYRPCQTITTATANSNEINKKNVENDILSNVIQKP